jgi:hypothetical protein
MKLKLIKIVLSVFLLSISFQSCILFKKKVTKPVVINVVKDQAIVLIESNLPYTKYIQAYKQDSIFLKFMKGFNFEASFTSNVTLVFNEEDKASYTLLIKKIIVNESSSVETINNEKSEFNGKQVELHRVNCSAEVELIKLSDSKQLPIVCKNNKDKTEKIKNSRDISDLISGSNKDNTIYRTKLLSSDVGMDLAEDVGKRIWVPITRKLAKN